MGHTASTKEKEIEQANAYYNGQLGKLDLSGSIQVKFSSLDGNTKWLSLNKESVGCILEFLNGIKDKLD